MFFKRLAKRRAAKRRAQAKILARISELERTQTAVSHVTLEANSAHAQTEARLCAELDELRWKNRASLHALASEHVIRLGELESGYRALRHVPAEHNIRLEELEERYRALQDVSRQHNIRLGELEEKYRSMRNVSADLETLREQTGLTFVETEQRHDESIWATGTMFDRVDGRMNEMGQNLVRSMEPSYAAVTELRERVERLEECDRNLIRFMDLSHQGMTEVRDRVERVEERVRRAAAAPVDADDAQPPPPYPATPAHTSPRTSNTSDPSNTSSASNTGTSETSNTSNTSEEFVIPPRSRAVDPDSFPSTEPGIICVGERLYTDGPDPRTYNGRLARSYYGQRGELELLGVEVDFAVWVPAGHPLRDEGVRRVVNARLREDPTLEERAGDIVLFVDGENIASIAEGGRGIYEYRSRVEDFGSRSGSPISRSFSDS